MPQLRVIAAQHRRRQHRALAVGPITGGPQACGKRVVRIEWQQRGGGLQFPLPGVISHDLTFLQRRMQAGQQRQPGIPGQLPQCPGVAGGQYAGVKSVGTFQSLQHK